MREDFDPFKDVKMSKELRKKLEPRRQRIIQIYKEIEKDLQELRADI